MFSLAHYVRSDDLRFICSLFLVFVSFFSSVGKIKSLLYTSIARAIYIYRFYVRRGDGFRGVFSPSFFVFVSVFFVC